MGRIFLVEDENTLRSNIAEILENEGHKVLQFGDGAVVLEYNKMHPNDMPDIIISDINMPQILGYELIRRWKAISPAHKKIPIIFLSAMGQKQDIDKGMILEAKEYLIKPVNFPVLLAKINNHLKAAMNFQIK